MRLFLIVLIVPHVFAARRSHSTTFARRQLLGGLLPDVLGSPASSAAPTTSILDPVTISPSSTTPVTTPTSTGGLLGQLTGPAGGLVSSLGGVVNTAGSDLGGVVSTVGGGVGSIIGGPPTSTPTSTPTPSTPSPENSSDPALSHTSSSNTTSSTSPTSTPTSSPGGIIGGLTSAVGGVTSDLGGGISTIGSDVGSVLNPPGPSTSPPANPPGPSTSPPANPPSGSPTQTSDHIPPPSTGTPTSSSNDGIIGGLTSAVGGVTSDLGSIVGTVTSNLGGIGATPTSSRSGAISTTGSGSGSSTSGLGGVLNTLTSDLGGVVSSATSDLGGVVSTATSGLGGVISTATSNLGGVISTATSSLGGVITTATSGVIPTSSQGPLNSANVTIGPTVSGPVNATSPTSSAFPNATSSAQPTISFPTQSTNVSMVTSTPSQNPTTTSFATVTLTTVTTLSVASELSFVLQESTLAFASVPTSTASATLTDPDQATTSVNPLIAQPATTLVTPALPSGIPGWIYPRQQLDPSNSDLNGYTLISILFNNELNWMFEIQDAISSSQLFVYMPMIITSALGISSDQVKTFALRVYVPDSYHGPNDAAQLGTLYLAYIPNNLVDPLAAQIVVKSSAFYTNGPDSNARTLAQHVISSYSLLSVSPNSNPGTGGSSNNSGSNSGSSDSGKTREEAIIGVVSALGAIAILVLGFLIYRSYKRRQQLAHRRLSDPPGENLGVRPQGRQFDQDSVGGARRRSFYYAEDSLRGYESQAGPNDQLMAESSTSQRRNVVPGSISAPVLRGSTMNW